MESATILHQIRFPFLPGGHHTAAVSHRHTLLMQPKANILLTQSYVIPAQRPAWPRCFLKNRILMVLDFHHKMENAAYFCCSCSCNCSREETGKTTLWNSSNAIHTIPLLRMMMVLPWASIFMHNTDKRSWCHFDCKVRKDSGQMAGMWDTNWGKTAKWISRRLFPTLRWHFRESTSLPCACQHSRKFNQGPEKGNGSSTLHLCFAYSGE